MNRKNLRMKFCNVKVKASNIRDSKIEKQVRERVRSHLVLKYGTLREAAEKVGISEWFCSQIVTGNRNLPQYMLSEIGLVRGRFIYRALTGNLISEPEALNAIHNCMKAERLTQALFAGRVGISQGSLSNALSGRFAIPEKILNHIGLNSGIFIFEREL